MPLKIPILRGLFVLVLRAKKKKIGVGREYGDVTFFFFLINQLGGYPEAIR